MQLEATNPYKGMCKDIKEKPLSRSITLRDTRRIRDEEQIKKDQTPHIKSQTHKEELQRTIIAKTTALEKPVVKKRFFKHGMVGVILIEFTVLLLRCLLHSVIQSCDVLRRLDTHG